MSDDQHILSDQQIDEGGAASGDSPWRDRVASADQWQDLCGAVCDRFQSVDPEKVKGLQGHHDEFVSEVATSTGMSREAVEAEFDEMTKS